MWCTRWFLPLMILPVPTAPPYFLAVFLVSSFLHTRPCFYCMVLLTALFTSSCYWQTVPIDAPLTRPLGNATTFGDAIRSNLSTPDVQLPPVIQLVDRCWCNVFSRSGLFEPSDVSMWERASVEAARRKIEMQWTRNEEKTSAAVSGDGDTPGRDEDKADVGDENTTRYVSPGTPFSLRALRDILFPTISATAPTHKYRLKPASSPTSMPHSPTEIRQETAFSRPETASESERIDASSDNADSRTTTTSEHAGLLRPYYDLRPYGLDITVDFRWNRQLNS